MTAEPLSASMQYNLVLLLAYSDEHAPAIYRAVNLNQFEGDFHQIATGIYGYIAKFGKAPKDHIVDIFEKIWAKDDTRGRQFGDSLKEIRENQANVDPVFVMDNLHSFIFRQQMMANVLGAADLINSGRLDDEGLTHIYMNLQTAFRQYQNPKGIKGTDVEPQPTEWLWHPYFPAGELTLLGGNGNIGKGLSLINLAARITRTPKKVKRWPDRNANECVGHVLWAEAEDSLEKTLIPRFIANRGNRKRITFFTEELFKVLDVRRFVDENNVRLIVLSPIISFLPRLKNSNDQQAVRAELGRLHDAVQGTTCSVVGIAHLNKKTDLDAIERLLGSTAFSNYVRSVILINWDEEREGWRRWVHAKHNLSVRGNDLLFEMVHVGKDPRDQFVKVRWACADQNADPTSFLDRRKGKPDHKPSAIEWLTGYLGDHDETLKTEVIKAGVAAGHTESAINQARVRSQAIQAVRRGEFPARTFWRLRGPVGADGDLI